MLRNLVIVFGSLFVLNLQAQLFNRIVPPGVQPYCYNNYGVKVGCVYLTAPVTVHPTKPGDGDYVEPELLIDNEGYVLWYGNKPARVLDTDFKFHAQQKLFSYCACIDSNKYIHYILNRKMEIVDSVININGVKPDAHDFLILPNGNYLLAGTMDSTVSLGQYMFNGHNNAFTVHLTGFAIQEINKKHELVWQWNSNEHLDPADYIEAYGRKSDRFDYCHGNSVSIANDGNYIVSFRNLDAAYKIDKNTGSILWKLGGKHSSFIFTNDLGLSGQHHVQQLPNGNVIAFNNGNSSPEKNSYAIEYLLDTVEHTATRVWKSPEHKNLYAIGMGSVQKFEDGTKMIGYGQVYIPNPAARVYDKSDSIKAEFYFKDSVMSYRTYMVEGGIKFPRPVVKIRKAKGSVLLEVPNKYGQYIWNTGETTNAITIHKEGTYMVWINYGNGMLGSKPVIITKADFLH